MRRSPDVSNRRAPNCQFLRASPRRQEFLKRGVIGHVGSKEEWLRLLHMAFHEEGVYTARDVVVVADGGSGIWELTAEPVPSTPSREVFEILHPLTTARHALVEGRGQRNSEIALFVGLWPLG